MTPGEDVEMQEFYCFDVSIAICLASPRSRGGFMKAWQCRWTGNGVSRGSARPDWALTTPHAGLALALAALVVRARKRARQRWLWDEEDIGTLPSE